MQRYPKYFIAIKKNEGDVLKSLDTFTPLLPPARKFYADPMLFKHRGVNYLFFEDFDYKKGVISCIPIDGGAQRCRKVLELPIHLSFPFVFEEAGEVYMVPETYDWGAVFLFKATRFPDRWKPERFLIRGQAFSDPILFKHNGTYWLFSATYGDRLSIHYAENLASEFLPHPINRKYLLGRNAGPVFSQQGRLVRPVMDCSQSYGRSMILKEIVHLDRTDFVERAIETIEPNWAPHLAGTHTYCQNGDYVVYDGHREIFAHEEEVYSSSNLDFLLC